MDNDKILSSLVIFMIFLVFLIPGKCCKGLPAEYKGSPKYYNRDNSPDNFEDMFFPRRYKGLDYNLTVPNYLQNKRLGNTYVWDKEYQGYAKPPDHPILPHPVNHANFTIYNDDSKIILTSDNKRTNIGGGGVDTFEVNNSSYVRMETNGRFTFTMVRYKRWDRLFKKEQTIEFNGKIRTYNLFGMSYGWIEGFDRSEQFIRVHIKSSLPLRSYIFEGENGLLVDYHEKSAKSIELDIRNDENHYGVCMLPSLTLVNTGDINETVIVKLSLEVLEYPHSWWLLPIMFGGIFLAIIAVIIWMKKR